MRVEQTPKASAQSNMESDEARLKSLKSNSEPILRFYEWETDAATYGYFVDPTEFFLEGQPLQIARRPTGGGIIFHRFDLAFSLLIPASHPAYSTNTLDNYAYVNERVIGAIRRFRKGLSPKLYHCSSTCATRFCMAKPTQYDVVIDGKKVGGAAQRRTKQGFLHQGSLCMTLPPSGYLEKVLKGGKQIAEEIFTNSYPLLSPEDPIEDAKHSLRSFLIDAFV
jgi:lipoate-protein ligase A